MPKAYEASIIGKKPRKDKTPCSGMLKVMASIIPFCTSLLEILNIVRNRINIITEIIATVFSLFFS